MKTKEFRMKKLVIISALILTLIMCIAFIAAIEAVTVTNPDLDAASLSLSLFKKPGPTGYAVDDSGNTIATVTVKAGEEVGRVNEYFYGAVSNREILTKEEYKQAWLNSGMKYLRIDAKFDEGKYSNNANPSGVYFTGDVSKEIELLKWAYENKIKILLITDFMPSWLADNSSGDCLQLKFCPPSNYTIWENIVLDYLYRISGGNITLLSIIDIEVWNEPDVEFFMGNLAVDNIKKAINYGALYNHTYSAIKEKYPDLKIGGPSQAFSWQPNMRQTFLSNFSNQIDFYAFHSYLGGNDKLGKNFYDYQKNQINKLLEDCEMYNTNCSRIIISEWNDADNEIKNTSEKQNQYGVQVALSYLATLEYPERISNLYYNFARDRDYSYSEELWESYVGKEYYSPIGRYTPLYNVTKDFAHYHAGGNMIVNSSSNNNSIKSVASLNPQGIWHITVINAATNNINVNLDVSSTSLEAIKDLATGTIYPVSNGIANVGILTEYEVKHYEGIVDYEVEKEVVTSAGGYSVGKNKIVSVENLNINTNAFAAIETDTSIVIPTSEIFVNTYTADKNTNEEKEEFYGPIQSEEDVRDIDYKTRTGSLSLAVSNNSYLAILIILLGSIICTSLIISIIYRKKKREAEKVKKLMEWVDKARALGYSNDKMKEMLAQYNWDKDLVEKVVGR